jgi:tRNA threonylcarbamoyladenosine biosynthesis protein TsaE
MSDSFLVQKETQLSEIIAAIYEQHKDCDIWLLTGDLGSGKTTFTKYLAEFLNITDTVSSPTFALINEYEIPADDRYQTLMHIDLYRLENMDELLNLGMEEILNRNDYLKIIEWPELAEPLVDGQLHLRVQITSESADSRKFVILKCPT